MRIVYSFPKVVFLCLCGGGVDTKMAPLLILLMAGMCWAQPQPVAPSTAPSTASQYLQLWAVPLTLRASLVAMGGRLQNPGQERYTLAGTYSDSKGSRGVKITWEIPGKVRIDLDGATPLSIVSDGTKTSANAGAATLLSNDDLIESLGDDRAETLLFGVNQSGFAWRFLGSWFRTDDGTTKNYTGPFYNIHQTNAPAKVRSDQAQRHKFFCFDSATALLAKTQYDIQRNGATVHVETVYTGWSTVSGQVVPGKIVRSENGANVITIQISSGQVSAAANDGSFVVP